MRHVRTQAADSGWRLHPGYTKSGPVAPMA